MYFVRTPYIIKKLFSDIVWDIPNANNAVFLTFDDGPNTATTNVILQQLNKYNAKATFFCLGENAVKYPSLIKEIVSDGHKIGNHGYWHSNGWGISSTSYLQNIDKGRKTLEDIIQQNINLFRAPYGKVNWKYLFNKHTDIITVNWSLMPGDFDRELSIENCAKNFIQHIKTGDIVCLHDSLMAYEKIKHNLPKWLDFLYNNGLNSEMINL